MSNEIRADGNLITRTFFRLLPIQILLAAINAVNNTVSSLFAANSVGPAAMSAIGFYNPINTLMCAVTGLFVCGSQIICGKYMGANQMDKTRNVFAVDIVPAVLGCLHCAASSGGSVRMDGPVHEGSRGPRLPGPVRARQGDRNHSVRAWSAVCRVPVT